MFFDPWDKAGECTEAIKISSDLELRTLLDATRTPGSSWQISVRSSPILSLRTKLPGLGGSIRI